MRDKLKTDWDDFKAGVKGEDPVDAAAGRVEPSPGQSFTDGIKAGWSADEDGSTGQWEAAGIRMGVFFLGIPMAMAWGVIVAGPGLALLPWGSPAGFVLTAVATVACGIWTYFPPESPQRNSAIAAGFMIALFAFAASSAVDLPRNALLNGALLVLANKELGRKHATRIGRISPAFFVVVANIVPLWREGKLLPFSGNEPTVGNAIGDLLRIGIIIGLMQMAQYEHRAGERAKAAAKEAESERDAAVSEERARIARELHDVVAHHVSVMTVQAEGARELLPDRPGKASEVLGTISDTGRAALTELRRMLGVLRTPDSDEDGGAEREPQPGTDQLQALVNQTKGAGLPTTLTITGDVRPLPAGIELSIYRVVQEALTNTLKHAGKAKATVTVAYGPDAVDVTVVDDGPGAAAKTPGGGHGLLGMRERVELVGGDLDAGPRRQGGFEVSAHFPVNGAESTSTATQP